MKYSPRFTYTFAPGAAGAGTLDLSTNANFNLQGLLAVIDLTVIPNVLVYSTGPAGPNASNASNKLTLQANTSACAAADVLQFFFDDGTDIVTVTGQQATPVSGPINSATSIIGPLACGPFNVATVAAYGTFSGVSFALQFSPDNVNWFGIQGSIDQTQLVSSGMTNGTGNGTSATNTSWTFPLGANVNYVRVLATAWTSGTCNIIIGAQTFAYDPCPSTVDQGAVAPGATVPATLAPVLVGGTDGTSARMANYTAKNAQGIYALNAQQLKDTGRNQTNYFSAGPVAAAASDTLLSLTGYKGAAAVAATTTPAVVTTGKTYRIVGITLTYVSTGSAGLVRFTLRANTSGVVAIGSPAVQSWSIGGPSTTAGLSQTIHIDFGDGMEFAAGTGIGISMVGLSSTLGLVASGDGGISIHGFEY